VLIFAIFLYFFEKTREKAPPKKAEQGFKPFFKAFKKDLNALKACKFSF